MFNAGVATQGGWVNASDGLLVRDINQDGLISSGAELFGQNTHLADGTSAPSAFAALAQFDANQDGKVDTQDAIFSELQVWRDANSDGVTDTGELHNMMALGIASFNLTASAGAVVQEHGNLHALISSYTTTDGMLHEMADVWMTQVVL
jgi:trimeric autotransporter adhesin